LADNAALELFSYFSRLFRAACSCFFLTGTRQRRFNLSLARDDAVGLEGLEQHLGITWNAGNFYFKRTAHDRLIEDAHEIPQI
jgi:hypothetical protein